MAWRSCSSTAATIISYAAFDLDGFSTDANGYFTLGNPGVPGSIWSSIPAQSGLLQNGADAVAIYAGECQRLPRQHRVTITNSWTRSSTTPTMRTMRGC